MKSLYTKSYVELASNSSPRDWEPQLDSKSASQRVLFNRLPRQVILVIEKGLSLPPNICG